MYKAIIFDFFGVIQTDPYQRWLNKHGLKREGAFAKASNDVDKNLISWDEFFETLADSSGQRTEDIREAFYEDQLTIDQELVKLIKELKANYKIGLLSNASNSYLRPLLRENGIEGLFDVDIISSEVGIIKPDVRIFQLTLEKLAARPEETIFIDDNSYNIEAANSLGIAGILYKDLATLREKLHELGVS